MRGRHSPRGCLRNHSVCRRLPHWKKHRRNHHHRCRCNRYWSSLHRLNHCSCCPIHRMFPLHRDVQPHCCHRNLHRLSLHHLFLHKAIPTNLHLQNHRHHGRHSRLWSHLRQLHHHNCCRCHHTLQFLQDILLHFHHHNRCQSVHTHLGQHKHIRQWQCFRNHPHPNPNKRFL